MPALTRRRDRQAHAENWLIFFGDIAVGSIGIRTGVPVHVGQWVWRCGCYPATHRGIRAEGTSRDFAQARADFESAWHELQPKITEADFTEHRRERAMTAWKHAMWESGCKLPTQAPDGRSRCICGTEINIKGTEQHVYAEHMEPA